MSPTRVIVGPLSTLQAGPADGRPLVLLHGIGGAAEVFGPQLEARFPGVRVVAVDFPGHGGSRALPAASIPAYAEAVAAMLAALPGPRPALAGHSLGGMVAQEILARGLAPVAGAILIATTPMFGGRDPAWAQAFLAARFGPLDAGATMAQLAPGIVADMVGEDPDPDGVALAVACMARVPEAAYRGSVRALVGFDRRADLERIAVPTLVLAAERDKNAPAPTMEKMAAKIPGATFVTLAGSGHLPNLERPAAFNAEIAAFLAKLGGTP